MIAKRKIVSVDPGSEIGRFLGRMSKEPVIVEAGQDRYQIVREREDLFANYDPERARAAVDQMFGALRDEDLQSLKEELRELREQDSTGRPA